MTRGALAGAAGVRRTSSRSLALCCLFVPMLARATEPMIDELSAPAGDCPGQAALSERLAQLSDPQAAPRHARVRITTTPSGFHTAVTLLSGNEARERAFDTETCQAGFEA